MSFSRFTPLALWRPSVRGLFCTASIKRIVTYPEHRLSSVSGSVRLPSLSQCQYFSSTSTALNSDPPVSQSKDYVVLLRGLPWSTSIEEVQNYFKDCSIDVDNQEVTMMVNNDGAPAGQAFVSLPSKDDYWKALEYSKKGYIGRRYIVVSESSQEDRKEYIDRRTSAVGELSKSSVVKMRGLPYQCREEQVEEFFPDLSISPGGVVIQVDNYGKYTGLAYVTFSSPEEAQQALKNHRNTIGDRYIEVYKCYPSSVIPVYNRRW